MTTKTDEAILRLCYVDEPWAYFTPRPLAEQSGDDWNDVPYEHNAEPPNGTDIVKVAYDGDFETPCDNNRNSPYSVDEINAGVIAWLRRSKWSSKPMVAIPAGTLLAEFCKLIRKGGGKVYTVTVE